nr:DUF6801 domain-containing protein [Kitasatospora cheerisanensis]
MRTIEGSVDADTRIFSPQGETAVPVHLAITRTSVPASGAFEIPATGNAPRLSFTRPGAGRVTADRFTLHLVPKDADGNLAGPGRVDVPCTLNGGQDNTVAPFEITPAKAAPTPSATASHSASASAPASASPATTPPESDAPAAATSPAPPPPSSAPAASAPAAPPAPAAGILLHRRSKRRATPGPSA